MKVSGNRDMVGKVWSLASMPAAERAQVRMIPISADELDDNKARRRCILLGASMMAYDAAFRKANVRIGFKAAGLWDYKQKAVPPMKSNVLSFLLPHTPTHTHTNTTHRTPFI